MKQAILILTAKITGVIFRPVYLLVMRERNHDAGNGKIQKRFIL